MDRAQQGADFSEFIIETVRDLPARRLSALATHSILVRSRMFRIEPDIKGVYWLLGDGSGLIEINPYLPRSLWRDTLVHELAHAFTRDEAKDHGERWQNMARELGAIPSPCTFDGPEYPVWHYVCDNPRCEEINEMPALDGPDSLPTMDDLMERGCDGCWDVPGMDETPDFIYLPADRAIIERDYVRICVSERGRTPVVSLE